MMSNIRFFFLLGFVILFSCNNDKERSSADDSANETIRDKANPLLFEIVATEPYETNNKAQVIVRAYVQSDSITKENLSSTVEEIYQNLKDYNQFKNFTSPTVIGVYLYTSKEKAVEMQESWIAMLTKTPSDIKPRISFDDTKLAALTGQKDVTESKDEKKYNELQAYFKERNTDLCTIYRMLYDIEGECINKADVAYPDFGIKHTDYSSECYKKEKKLLFKKYRINDTLSSYITVFATSYCK